MSKSIIDYQKAFNSIVEQMKENHSVIGILAFGSITTGDLWEGSDIDLFVIVKEDLSEMKNLYTEENGIGIHIKLTGKKNFISIWEQELKGGYMHRIFSSSKLVYSKDVDINSVYDKDRYFPDIDREKWNMVYLGQVLKNINECKKFLHNDVLYTAYSLAVICVKNYSKLYVNYSGYMISRDVLTMSLSVNERLNVHVEELFEKGESIKEPIINILNFIEKEIEDNLKGITSILLEYMGRRDVSLSAEEIRNDELFKGYDIQVEEILNKLWEMNILKRSKRPYIIDEKQLLLENVYYI